ncbi:hypothetical protein Belba_3690 [Belliella baltica DSM 15883]|uniref:Lipocalin-like domain-containing protein n=1 Tax=Belliella baltica (strain DSM 15883 / CIP 108006 / LMG 21964 / BA134) TaxID=866536 RepID=I3ZAB2_BELBD|nr:hypothetical protein [Belliella baltica]AFL86180.1 hypothetical protein Belba_3690 [Belliella baltica DSM 15883]
MKIKFSLLLIFVATLFACNQDEKDPYFNILGYWEIAAVTNSWTGEVTSGDQLNFSERYIFNDDSTFIKFSNKNHKYGQLYEEPAQALGTYEMKLIEDSSNVFELKLTFETNMGMAVSCGGDTEYLVLTKENKLMNTGWAACDGPSFTYQK